MEPPRQAGVGPRIQYAQTKDGVSIAFWTLGEGMPFVEMPIPPWSHVQMELQVPLWRAWDERLAEKRVHVRYDHRGSGLSERNITNLSLDALVLDLEAVVDRLGLGRFALFGHHVTGAAAIAYAARNPDRVSHLILWCALARGTDFAAGPQVRALLAVMKEDWETYTETLAHVAFGWSQGEEARRFAVVVRGCATPEVEQAYSDTFSEFDVTDLLPEVQTPTLVIQRRGYLHVPVTVAQELASKIPNAQLVLLEGTTGVTYMENMEALAAAIDEFLGEGEEAHGEALAAGDVHTILFTDMESSTALTQRLGDARAQEVRRTHNTIVRDALKAHSGSEVKHTGDGIMASFSTASQALDCAIAIQRGVAAHLEQQPDSPLGVYIGLNVGEPIAEEQDLFGTSVDLARRICEHAESGQILVPDAVRHLAAGKGFLFSDIGEVVPKGFEDPVRLYEVRWQEED